MTDDGYSGFYDPEDSEQDCGKPGRFVIDNDEKAEWAVKKIKEAEDEHDRLVALVEQERAALDDKEAKFDKALERDTAFLKFALSDYMRTVKCKATRTQESYQLLSGKLIRKKASVDYKVNDEALVGWLRENKRDDLVSVTVKPRWGDIKKLLIADPESGAVVIAETGEEEIIELDDGPHPRTISKRYTASLNEKSNLRADLAAWRGRDFSPEELAAFDLRNIVGKSCLINIIHSTRDGKTYANIGSVMALPKGMAKGKLSEPPTVFDLDTDPLDMVEKFPKWIGDLIKKSSTYQDRLTPPPAAAAADKGGTTFQELENDDGALPF